MAQGKDKESKGKGKSEGNGKGQGNNGNNTNTGAAAARAGAAAEGGAAAVTHEKRARTTGSRHTAALAEGESVTQSKLDAALGVLDNSKAEMERVRGVLQEQQQEQEQEQQQQQSEREPKQPEDLSCPLLDD